MPGHHVWFAACLHTRYAHARTVVEACFERLPQRTLIADAAASLPSRQHTLDASGGGLHPAMAIALT